MLQVFTEEDFKSIQRIGITFAIKIRYFTLYIFYTIYYNSYKIAYYNRISYSNTE